MNLLKINENQFLGKHELNRLVRFLSEDGFKSLIKSSVSHYGVVKLPSDINFDALRITEGSNAISININRGEAINQDVDRIIVKEDIPDVISNIPADNVKRILYIKRKLSYEEEGTVSVAINGALVGTNTKFTEVLRGQPNHPIEIQFTNSLFNTQRYEVLSVTSNTVAQIIGASFTAESNLKYKVSGTFVKGVQVLSIQRDIYGYEEFELILMDESYEPIEGFEFPLASLRTNGTTLEIIDLRSNNIYSLNNQEQQASDEDISTPNFVMGVESVKYDHSKSSKSENLMRIGWGIRPSDSSSWIADPANNKITITSGIGGIYSASGDLLQNVPVDALVGWRVYFDNGNFTRVISNLSVGGQLEITLQDFNTQILDTSGNISVVPNIDGILFMARATTLTNENKYREFYFPVVKGYADVLIPAGGTITWNYKNISGARAGATNLFNNGFYILETSYNENGVLTGQPDLAISLNGSYNSNINPNNHHDQKGWLNQDNTWLNENDFLETVRIFNLLMVMEDAELLTVGSLKIAGQLFHSTGLNLLGNAETFNNLPVFAEISKIVIGSIGNTVIKGIESGQEDKIITIHNTNLGNFTVTLLHNSLDANNGNKINLPLGKDLIIYPGDTASFVYQSNAWYYLQGSVPLSIIRRSNIENSLQINELFSASFEGTDIVNVSLGQRRMKYHRVNNLIYLQVRVRLDWGGLGAAPVIDKLIIDMPSDLNTSALNSNAFVGQGGNSNANYLGTVRGKSPSDSNEINQSCLVEFSPQAGALVPVRLTFTPFFNDENWAFVNDSTPMEFQTNLTLFI